MMESTYIEDESGQDLDAEAVDAAAVNAPGGVFTFGSNSVGQLGDGTNNDRFTPVQTINLLGATSVVAGVDYSVALLSDGALRAFGSNSDGQLGINSTTNSASPVQVQNAQGGDLAGVAAVVAGDAHCLALLPDGTVLAWGNNASGQLGDGTTTDQGIPVQVQGLDQARVKSVAAGTSHSLVLLSDGTVRACGDNSARQLGDGTTTNSTTPVVVKAERQFANASGDLAGVKAVAAGGFHSVALLSNGKVLMWGSDGTITNKAPKEIRFTQGGVTAIATGQAHSLILSSDGRVFAFGGNQEGQLGNGTTDDSGSPVFVRLPFSATEARAIAVAAGASHSVALMSDGTVRSWGSNFFGQLGDGTTVRRTIPVPVRDLTGAVSVAAGRAHSVVLQ